MRYSDYDDYRPGYRRNSDASLQELRRQAASGDRGAQMQIGRELNRNRQKPENLQEFADWLLAHPNDLRGGLNTDDNFANELLSWIYEQSWFLGPLKKMILNHLDDVQSVFLDETRNNILVTVNTEDDVEINLNTNFKADSEAHGEEEATQLDFALHDLEIKLSETPHIEMGYSEGLITIDLRDDVWNLDMDWDDNDDPPGLMEVSLTVKLGIHHLLGVFEVAQINKWELLETLKPSPKEPKKRFCLICEKVIGEPSERYGTPHRGLCWKCSDEMDRELSEYY